MNLQSEKKNLIKWISEIEDESTIEHIKIFRENYKNGKDWWNGISESERKGIDEGLKDFEEGRTVSYGEVKEEVKKWLSK